MTSPSTSQGEKRLGRQGRFLTALLDGPKTNAELQAVFDELPVEVSQYMAKLRKAGLVENTAVGQPKALYDLTDAGRARVAS